MSPLRLGYLALALTGAAVQVARLVATTGQMSDPGFRDVHSVVVGVADPNLVVAAIALTLFVLAETFVRRNWPALWAIPATILLGLGCGLPLYLFLRTRPVG